MSTQLSLMRQQANHTRYQSSQQTGHYESFFLRANHPTRPLAFWIRYTSFSPHHRPQEAIGELWAIFFDGETNRHIAVKQELSLDRCVFSTSEFFIRVGDACLEPGKLKGNATLGQHAIAWDLTYHGEAEPLFLLPFNLYDTALPKAKSLVGLPLAVFDGSLTVDGNEINVAIAACELKIIRKREGTTELLSTHHRAAFEILTDDRQHGVEIRV